MFTSAGSFLTSASLTLRLLVDVEAWVVLSGTASVFTTIWDGGGMYDLSFKTLKNDATKSLVSGTEKAMNMYPRPNPISTLP